MLFKNPWNLARDRIWRQFRLLRKEPTPKVPVPTDPQDALQLGWQLGLQQGYGKGLTAGVGLGHDVGEGKLPVSFSTDMPS